MSDNHRTADRRRVLKAGTIAYNQRYSTLPCTVRDLSATGARLRVSDVALVPTHFDLLIDLDGFEVACEVCWRTEHEVGIKFLGEPRIRPAVRRQVVQAVVPQRPSLRRKP